MCERLKDCDSTVEELQVRQGQKWGFPWESGRGRERLTGTDIQWLSFHLSDISFNLEAGLYYAFLHKNICFLPVKKSNNTGLENV